MPVYTEYGDFKSEKDFRSHLKKLEDLRKEGNWNGWLLVSPPRSFVVWQSPTSSDAVILYKSQGRHYINGEPVTDELRHWLVLIDRKGRVRSGESRHVKQAEQAVKRRERNGTTFELDMTRVPPKALERLHWLDPACLALRDFLHRKDDDPRYDAQHCFRRDCDQMGVYLQDSDPRPWNWYMLCDDHRPDTLDPVKPWANLQTTVRRGNKRVHINHRVRSNENGGTPGPTLCGLERFGPDAPIKGFSVGGGVMGPDSQPAGEVCEACVKATDDLLHSPEFLERRNRWLERRLKEAEVKVGGLTKVRDDLAIIQTALNEQVDTLQQRVVDRNRTIEAHVSVMREGQFLAQDFLNAYDRITARLNEFDAEFISRFIGYREAVFEPVVAKAKELIHETE